MPIKIKSSGGGSVSFDVDNIGSDFTLTAPANNATLFTTAGGTITGNVAFTSNNVSIGGQTISSAVGMRNRIINGAMAIDQRANGTSVSISSDARAAASDRFVAAAVGGGVFTLQRVVDAPTDSGFIYSLKATVTTSSTPASSGHYYQINQRIEGYNIADLGWGASGSKTATLSFWVKSSITGTYGISFLREAASSYRSYVSTYTINSANTWEYKTITVSGDTVLRTADEYTNGTGVCISFQLGLSSIYQTSSLNQWQTGVYTSSTTMTQLISTNGATFNVTGVQFEAGSVATPFEFRHYTNELQLCQRYFIKPNDVLSGVGQGGVAYFYCFNTNEASGNNVFPVQMRAAPTITYYDNNNNAGSAHRLGVGDVSSVNAGWINKNAWAFLGKSSGWSAGNLLGCAWQASAEL